MAITARLSHKLHQTLGDEAAEDLVNWMQHVDAQRAELRELNELNFSRIDARLAEMVTRAEFDVKLGALREEMRVGFAGLEAKLERRISDLIKWSFVFWVGAVGAIAMLAGVLP